MNEPLIANPLDVGRNGGPPDHLNMLDRSLWFADRLRDRGLDPAKIHPDDWPDVYHGRTPPKRHPVTGVILDSPAVEPSPFAVDAPLPSELVFTPIEQFAAIDEPGAEPLVTASVGGTVIPAKGLVLIYGSGGAGKTTLVVDIAFALAAGKPWLGILEPARALRVKIIENEGPRPELRKKLRRKLAQHPADLEGRISILDEPWGRFTFADAEQRRTLARALTDTDLLVVGPLSRVGTEGAGNLVDIGKFLSLIRDVRDMVERPFAVLTVHHENRAGQTSGAWENDPDTLVHVTGQGHGRTRVFWQKVRWSSELHATSTHLLWADGESYTVEEKPEITDDTIADDLLEAVRQNPGGSWTKLREHVTGNTTEAAKVRDRLIAAGTLVNSAPRDGHFKLWHADDPACPRSALGTALERLSFPPPAGTSEPTRSTVPDVSRNGERERHDEPEASGLESDGGT